MPDPEHLTIGDGVVAATITPGLGAGLSRFDYVAGGRAEPVFKPSPRRGPRDPAMFLLLPFSNRISGGGFMFRGKFNRLEPNVPGEPYPIHGDGFVQSWRVVDADAVSARLQLRSAGEGTPFRYDARVSYWMRNGSLTVELAVENRGHEPLPFGLGFHPWLARTPDVTLQAPAAGVWLETPDHLRAGDTPVAVPPEWDFTAANALPGGFINNGFSGRTNVSR